MDRTLAGKANSKYIANGGSACILKSLDPNINDHVNFDNASGVSSPVLSNPKMTIPEDFQSLNILDDIEESKCKSVLLLDDNETLKATSEKSFFSCLNLEPNTKTKVVSIFGNTGEGKSYTLNNVFFNGEEVFRTSASQVSCTLGVWAKYDPNMKVICLDTEGLLGISKKEHQRTRLLLKVLAISDIIIYRTRAERLQRDMYTFLGDASRAYKEHFYAALQKALAKSEHEKVITGLGPSVIIFHETHHTDTLHDCANVTASAEDIIRSTFATLRLSFDGFSSMKYVGVKSGKTGTSFEELKVALQKELESTKVRSPRDAKYIYLMLKSLNEKFNSTISDASPQLYLPSFFTCPEKCHSCKNGCSLSMGHADEGEPHFSGKDCTFQHQYQNCVYLCKKCFKDGKKIIVKPSYQTRNETSWTSYLTYVWTGWVIECPNCGEIYRSWKHWYGNKNPEESSVRIDIVHIWPGDRALFGTQNAAQKVLDGVSVISDAVASVGSQPTKVLSDWMADKIAPSYWRPNHEIKECFKCHTPFAAAAKKHHCRACGEGFCQKCSSKKQPVPARGWLNDVRVCDDCYQDVLPSLANAADDTEIRVRQIGETVVNSISVVKSVLDIPVDFIKDTARPAYWTPDAECRACAKCRRTFGDTLALHHCRDCGRGVCDGCSQTRKPVPLRGWDSPQRVCDDCR